jgi:hypothetical protein
MVLHLQELTGKTVRTARYRSGDSVTLEFTDGTTLLIIERCTGGQIEVEIDDETIHCDEE